MTSTWHGAPLVGEGAADQAPELAYSTPWDAPLVGSFPVRYRNAWILTACYRTELDAIRKLVPPPLTVTSPVVMIHIYSMADADFLGPYHECNVMVGVELTRADQTTAGGYSPWLYLDSDGGLALGREVHGQPKKLGLPRVELRGDLVVGTLERNGIEVITATLPYKQRPSVPADLLTYYDFAENINFKVVPHIDGTSAIRQLTARRLADLTVHECWTGPCTVELRPNAQAPVFRLPVVEPLNGFYWNADFTLQPGRILYDYLAPEAPPSAKDERPHGA
ncbi:MAG: acetoacetate decarboxylase family protein [Candidatus Dormibacteraceae bacterium]